MLLQPGVYIIVIIENTVSAILHTNNYRKTSLERYLVLCGTGENFFRLVVAQLRISSNAHFIHSVKSALKIQ